jgi:hypothetical protein
MTTKETLSKLYISIILLSVFCFLPVVSQAQDIPSTLFGDYEGDANVVNTTFAIDETISGVTVALKKTGEANDYILSIDDFDFYDIDIVMDNVIITPYGDGYKLTRSNPITFTIPEVTVPPIPPLLPEGGTFTNVPVKITLENTTIIDFVMNLNMKAVTTIIVVIIIPIPIDIPFNISFLGEIISLPPPPPPVIITSELEEGTIKEEYFVILEAESEPPVTWSIENGSLPTGLQLIHTSGLITGIPTEADVFNFTVMATNESGSDTKQLTIKINDEIDTLNIKTPLLASIKVCPNPTTGQLRSTNYEFNKGINPLVIEIYDVYSRKMEEKFPSNSLEGWQSVADGVVLDISHFPAGIYFLKIKTESGTVTKKIIKK